MKFLVKIGIYVPALLSILVFLVYPTLAQSLGMGAAETQSFIGENMRVRVPLFNVENPGSLEIELENLDGQSLLLSNINAQIDTATSPPSVLVQSEQAVNEPFFSFSLRVNEGGATVSRDFTVLFDLPRSLGSNYDVQDLDILPSASIENSEVTSVSSITPEMMGPYDWAKAGQIPAKFGPVLDGQSLWRVARRINQAMGVTQEQMMWALYEANPQAFSTSSVESLRAGEILTIPSESQVRATGFSEAKKQLLELSSSPQVALANTDEASTGQLPESSEAAPIDEFVESSSSSEPAFQLTGVDGSVNGNSLNEEQASSIIESLAETVGNLSQELIRKDQRISVLQGQVEELTNFIREDGNELPIIADATLESETNASADDSGFDDILNGLDDESNLDETSNGLDEVGNLDADPISLDADEITPEDTTLAELDDSEITLSTDSIAVDLEEPTRSDVVTLPAVRQPVSENKNKYLAWLESNWKWLLALLAIVFAFFYLLRERLSQLFQFLKFGNRDDELDLNRPLMTGMRSARDYSAIQSQRGGQDGNELAEGISYIDLEEDNSDHGGDESSDAASTSENMEKVEPKFERVTNVEQESDEIDYDDGSFEENEVLSLEDEIADLEDFDEDNEADLTFDERFTRLIAEQDFSFARELLDFARHNEINDDRYHCERLRLLKAMDDEDGFYEYYYEIEAKIPGFPPKLQTEISQFVVQLAQTG